MFQPCWKWVSAKLCCFLGPQFLTLHCPFPPHILFFCSRCFAADYDAGVAGVSGGAACEAKSCQIESSIPAAIRWPLYGNIMWQMLTKLDFEQEIAFQTKVSIKKTWNCLIVIANSLATHFPWTMGEKPIRLWQWFSSPQTRRHSTPAHPPGVAAASRTAHRWVLKKVLRRFGLGGQNWW